ncbi:substrate-binding domain-containing protein [Sphingomonas sp.]|uniref:substrate-binding domain-containing protein n=1 Tax=Sphingomonas sp. TaxID=28214 RepID=UPI0025FD72D3|nr:substrate-binding domain-containing protein [Sphingomonas sp.]
MRVMPLLAALALAGCSAGAAPKALTVCADPNNLPFSNRAGQGFENRIAEIVARDMHRPVRYVWWAQRRGYVRNTLGEQKCDLWPGVASGVEMVATTRPYYRSTYVFVTRADRNLKGLTLDDPRLKALTIGVQMVGDDAMNTPPAHALTARGMTRNVRGFMLYGDYAKPNPPADVVRAVADGKVDVSLAWGPLAGYFAKSSPVPLRIERVTPWLDNAQWPMVYDISMGVRKYDPAFQQQVETILTRRKKEIAAILDRYGVPRVD